MRMILPALAACTLLAAPAAAQQSGNGLVVVNISDVIDDIAVDLDVSQNQIPVTVQVPVSVAAAICDLDVNVLAKQRNNGGQRNCTATSSSTALTRIVQKNMRK